MIQLSKIKINLGSKVIFQDFSLTINPKKITALIGPSGCGKSTLLNALLGTLSISEGSIRYDEKIFADAKERLFLPLERRGLGIVFQDLALFEHINVKDNIAFGLGTLKKAEREARIEEISLMFKIKDHWKKFPREISGGERQRLALARTLAPWPKYVLMDESFSALDPLLKSPLRNEVREIFKRLGQGCLLVSHDLEEVQSFAEEIIIIDDKGALRQQGVLKEILAKPSCSFVERFLEKLI